MSTKHPWNKHTYAILNEVCHIGTTLRMYILGLPIDMYINAHTHTG